MQVLKLTGAIDSNGHLQVNIPTELPAGEVELVLVISPTFLDKSNQNSEGGEFRGGVSTVRKFPSQGVDSKSLLLLGCNGLF